MAAVACLLAAGSVPAGADTPTTSTAPTTAAASTTTAVVAPATTAGPDPADAEPAPGSPPPAVPLDEGSGEDVPPDRPPEPTVVVPADPTPGLLSPEQARADAALARRLGVAEALLVVAAGEEVTTVGQVAVAEVALADLAATGERAVARQRSTAVALAGRRERVRRWAVAAYTGGGLRRLALVLESRRVNEVPRRLGLVTGAFGAVDQSLRDEEVAAAGALGDARRAATAAAVGRDRLEAARRAAADASLRGAQLRSEVAALAAGRQVSAGGVAFPVSGPSRYGHTFGAPRMAGTPWAHAHEGVDVFAPSGAAVVAFERGVVDRLGTDLLGGTKLWLVGQSGTRYYYAHLQGYVAGLVSGAVVEAGQPVGFVGDTGNARGSSPHLHFEVHPGGGPAVDPAPILDQLRDVAFGLAAAGPPPTGTG